MKLFNMKTKFKNHDLYKNLKNKNLGPQEQMTNKKMLKNVNGIIKQNRLLSLLYNKNKNVLNNCPPSFTEDARSIRNL